MENDGLHFKLKSFKIKKKKKANDVSTLCVAAYLIISKQECTALITDHTAL